LKIAIETTLACVADVVGGSIAEEAEHCSALSLATLSSIVRSMVSRLYTPLTSFAGGMLIGAYYSDDLRASANLASNRVSLAEL
jgi:hypothetical protein